MQHYADKRPRIKGRFVSPEEFAAWQQAQQAKVGGAGAGAAAAAASPISAAAPCCARAAC